MREFGYVAAGSVAEAVELFRSAPGGRYLGGGTNLVDLMKLGVERPEFLVDVSGLPLDRIEETEDGGLLVGATVANSDLAADLVVRTRFPAVAQALLAGASGQVRNMATVGGNLLQRTRCGYFTDVTKPCNKRLPGSGCSAREGEHRNAAVLGATQHCVATHPSDLAVALVALDAVVHLQDGSGARRLPLRELYLPVGDSPERETALDEGALITAVEIPPLPFAARSRYRKVRERASFAFAVGSVAAAVQVTDGHISDARIALGAVASMPWRATLAERALIGTPAGPAGAPAVRAAAEAELAAAGPLRDNVYKVDLARNLIVRMVTDLVEEQQ